MASSFKSKDIHQVATVYETGLRGSGFTVQSKDKGGVELDLHGESPDRKRIIDVTIEQLADKAAGKPASAVTVAAVQK